MQSLEIISVNIWSILVSLANLLIMFLILKRFLFKPVQKMMAARKQQVDQIYQDAKENRDSAINMKQEYEARLAAAREEADGLVRNAVQTAQRKGDQILAEASGQARPAISSRRPSRRLPRRRSRCFRMCAARSPISP